jgi:F0F1-type ATP synthase membrane subunit b/b'
MEQLGIDIKLLLAQITNFVIFFFIFRKFIAKPFTNYVANEKKKEHEMAKMSKELEEKYTRMQEEEKKWQKELQTEKDSILGETKKVADQLKADTLAQTKKESEEMIAKAEKQISDERQAMYNDIKKKTVDLSTYIVEKGLNEYLTDDVKRNLTRHIVSNLGKEVKES